MTIRSWDDAEVTREAEALVAANVGNAKVRAFAREILRLRAALSDAERAVLAEREACAKAAHAGGCSCSKGGCAHDETGEVIAARIRARSTPAASGDRPTGPLDREEWSHLAPAASVPFLPVDSEADARMDALVALNSVSSGPVACTCLPGQTCDYPHHAPSGPVAVGPKPTGYNTGSDAWTHGQPMGRGTKVWGEGDGHHFLGPCPACGERTFDYGGGWRCCALHCFNNPDNPAPTVGPAPAWWNTGVNVYKDGPDWCAVGPGFVNLQETPAGFGNSPQAAVDDLAVEAAKPAPSPAPREAETTGQAMALHEEDVTLRRKLWAEIGTLRDRNATLAGEADEARSERDALKADLIEANAAIVAGREALAVCVDSENALKARLAEQKAASAEYIERTDRHQEELAAKLAASEATVARLAKLLAECVGRMEALNPPIDCPFCGEAPCSSCMEAARISGTMASTLRAAHAALAEKVTT